MKCYISRWTKTVICCVFIYTNQMIVVIACLTEALLLVYYKLHPDITSKIGITNKTTTFNLLKKGTLCSL